jgi:hypothetical protein
MTDHYDRWIGAVDNADEWVAKITAALAEIMRPGSELRQIVDAWPRLNDRLTSMTAAVRGAVAQAELPPCRLLSLDDWGEVEAAHREHGVGDAAQVVLRLSREALMHEPTRTTLVRDWRENVVVATRAEILEQALEAHVQGKYALSVPPFLAQLEGIVADAKHPANRRMSQDNIKDYVRQVAAGDDLMGTIITDFVSNVVLANFYRGDPVPPFSRHAILHGADTTYANERNSIKAILTFDYVQYLLREES